MIYWVSWAKPARIRDWLVGHVARLPARVQTKLLAAFLTIAGLLIVLGAVGLQVLNGVNGRTDDLIKLQRKIAAYQQVQHDTTNQLYSISTALLLQDDRMLDAALRQLNQFGYDLDRMEFVAQDEVELLGNVRKDYERFTQTVTRVVESIRAGRTAEARDIQLTEIVPLADRLERQTNQLVNIAEAGMVAAIDATSRTYQASRVIVIVFALGSLLLALGLGYVISLSLIAPVREIETRLRRIAAGDFTQRVEVANRDELGELAGNVNQTSEKLGRLYDEIETHRRDLSESLQQQTATAEVLKVISRSAFDLQTVLDTLAESAAHLCEADIVLIHRFIQDEFRVAASHGVGADAMPWLSSLRQQPGRGSVASRVLLEHKTVHVPDFEADPDYTFVEGPRKLGIRAILGVPLLREGALIGLLLLQRKAPDPFSGKQIELCETFADQAVIAIENVRLFDEVQQRTREATEALEYQTATSDVLGVISRSPTDVQPVFESIAESAARLCNARICNVVRYDGELIHHMAHHGMTAENVFAFKQIFPLVPSSGSAFGRAVLSGKLEIIPDLLEDRGYMMREITSALNWRSLAAVPMLQKSVVVGAIAIYKSEPGNFPERQIKILQTFADQAVIAIENARLFEEVQARTRDLSESLQQQTATAEVLQVISRSAFDLDTVLDTLVKSAARLCNATFGVIFLRDGDMLRAGAMFGTSKNIEEFKKFSMPIGHGTVFGRVVLSGQIENVPDIEADAERYPVIRRFSIARAGLGVPLLREGKVDGVFFLGRPEPGSFSERQSELVQTFANQAVIAIENVRLFDEVQARNRDLSEALEQQTATSAILRAIAASPTDIQPVLDAVAESAAKLCDTYDAAIVLRDGDCLVTRAHYGPIPIPFAKRPIGRDWPAGRAFVDRTPVFVEDFTLAAAEFPLGAELAQQAGFRSALAVPLMREGEAIGVIGIRRLEVRPFSQKQIALLTTFADQAVIAIENVRLFEEVQARTRDLSESLQQQTATADVLKVISRSVFDLDSVLETLIKSAVDLCRATMGGIFLPSGQFFRLAAQVGMPAALVEYELMNPFIAGPGTTTGRVVLTRSVVHIPDVLGDAEYAYTAGQKLGDYRAMLGVPLIRDNEVIGVFSVARLAPGPFAPREIELVQTFADQAVMAIGNVRLFEEVQQRTRELQESLEYQTATSEILNVISRSPTNLQPVMDVVAENAARVCGATDAIIFRVDGDILRLVAAHGVMPVVQEVIDHGLAITRGTTSGRSIIDRRSIHVADIAAELETEYPDAKAHQKRVGYRTVLSTPLLRDGVPLGAIHIRRFEVKPFTDKQIALLETFADQAVIAIENVRLFEEVQARTRDLSESLQQQTATADVLKVISRSVFDLDSVLSTLVKSALDLCRASGGNIHLRDGGVFRIAAQVGWPDEFAEYMRQKPIEPGRGSVAGRAILTRSVVQIPDVLADPEYTMTVAQKMVGYRALLGVPLIRDDEIIGVFSLGRSTPEPFLPREVDLVQTFSDQAVMAIGNVRLFEEVQQRTRELQESLEYQTATSEILNVISRSPTDLQPVMNVVAENAARICAANDAQIFRIDGEVLRPVASHGPMPAAAKIVPDGLPIVRGLVTGRAVLDRRTIHVADLAAELETEFPDAKPYQQAIGHRTSLATPLLREGVPLGVIHIRRMEVKPFSEKQIALLETFADQAVIAIENVRLFEEVQAKTRDLGEALQQQTATADVLKSISSSAFDLDAVLRTLVKSAAELCHAPNGIIVLRDGDVYRIASLVGFSREFHDYVQANPFVAGRGTVTGRVALTAAVVHAPDVLDDPDYAYTEGQKIGLYRTLLGVPLLRDGEVKGVFTLARPSVQPFNQREIELVETFADQAVIAIENVRLFEEVQQRTAELGRSVGELKALGEVSQAVNSTLDLKTVLETIVAKAVQLSETDAGTIYVYSKATQKFRLRATYGMSAELTAAITSQTVGLQDAGIGEAARSRAPLQMPDLSQGVSSPVHQIVLDAGYRSVLIMPLLRPNKVVGALVVRRRTTGRFPDSTVQLMQTFAAQSVLAIQNARLFSEIEEKGKQLEIASRHKSQFLANMSHELRTPLNSVLGFSEMLADGLYGQLPEKAVTTLARIQANGKHLLGLINDVLDLSKIEAGQLQLVIDSYSPGQIVKAAAAAAEPLARAKNLALNMVIAEGMPLGRGDERRLTQVLINLAGNAVKFTDQGSVEIAVQATNGSFEFTVRDTGPGIAPEFQSRIFDEFQQVDDSSTRKKGGTGLGLAISKRIVEMHGGTIGVESTLGAGSEFKATIPVNSEPKTEAT